MVWINELNTVIEQWLTTLGWPSEVIVRLLVAALLGGMIGLEREIRGHEAGLRTNMLVSLGSALAMVVSLHFARMDWSAWPSGSEFIRVDPARIAYGVMGGIGFLGAGTIMQTKGLIRGMTTAASIWCAAAIGLAAGVGMLLTATFVALLVLITLTVLRVIEPMFPSRDDATIVLGLPDTTRQPEPTAAARPDSPNQSADAAAEPSDEAQSLPDILEVRDRFNKKGFAVKQLDLEHNDEQQRWELTILCHHFTDKISDLLSDMHEHRDWRVIAVRRIKQ